MFLNISNVIYDEIIQTKQKMDTTLLDSLLEIIKLIIPAAAAIFAVKFTLKSYEEKETKKANADIRLKEVEILLPARLQAYERICMLIERISPQNIIPRINNPSMNAILLQQALSAEIRNELNHNLSQQVYVSAKAWHLTKQTAEAVKGLIIKSMREIKPDSTANDLARKILENTMALNPNPIENALDLIKSEIHSKF